MDAAELAFAGIHRQAELLRAGDVSSRDLVAIYLERIERFDGRLNAFRVVLAERALAEAAEADRRIAAGETRAAARRPDRGQGRTSTSPASSTTARDRAPSTARDRADSAQYRRLREAGAVLLGKTNLPELAIWPFTETADVGRGPATPGTRAHSTGGSSGGSGAAVAAGLVGAASASDGGGSIRIPAAHCGLFGLKPQRGRISLMPEPEHWLGLSVTGCLTRRVIDTALWLDVAAGPEPGDADTPPPPERPYVEAAADAARKLADRTSVSAPSAGRPADHQRRGQGRHRPDRRRPRARSATPSSSATPTGAGSATTSRPATSAASPSDGRAVPNPERLERRTRGMIRMGGAAAGRRRSPRPRATRPSTPSGSTGSSRTSTS